MEIWIDDNLTRFENEPDFYNELQYQINCFIISNQNFHRYYSAYLPIAVETYWCDANNIIAEESEIDYDELLGEHKKKNGGRFL